MAMVSRTGLCGDARERRDPAWLLAFRAPLEP
jgi:hypothetical protein